MGEVISLTITLYNACYISTYTSILLCFNSLTELCLYVSYVHVLRFVGRLLNQDWIGLDWIGLFYFVISVYVLLFFACFVVFRLIIRATTDFNKIVMYRLYYY